MGRTGLATATLVMDTAPITTSTEHVAIIKDDIA
jgi:hypothetical protein